MWRDGYQSTFFWRDLWDTVRRSPRWLFKLRWEANYGTKITCPTCKGLCMIDLATQRPTAVEHANALECDTCQGRGVYWTTDKELIAKYGN